MILTLDIGNSQIHGAVYSNNELQFQFRMTSKFDKSADEIGIFLLTVLRENRINSDKIKQIGICSVVPQMIHSLKGACSKYFQCEPFILQAGVRTGLKIKYRNPVEVGADRIANAVAGLHLFPEKNLIIVDYGTATTFCAITAERDYLGGLILPGFKISMEALESKTAKLTSVEIVRPTEIIGRSTTESIQSGLYYSNLYALKGILGQIKRDNFKDGHTIVIGTGGFSRLLEQEAVFDYLIPDLVHRGLLITLELNK